MTFTYDPSQLATSALFQVRFEIGDTDSAAPLLDDNEILYAISVESGLYGAAARCAETLVRKFGALADVQLGANLRIEYSRRQAGFVELAKQLRQKDLGTVLPFVGGRSIAAKEAAEADPDAVQPLFTKTMQQNPRAGGPNSDPIDDRLLP